jgi:uncharacterized phiE125 gp8 family phage protein
VRIYPTCRTAEVTAAASEPVTLSEAKLHCRVDHSDEDALITSLISVAREFAERSTGRTLAQRTFTMSMTAFPDAGLDIIVQRSPLISVQSVNYYDSTGTNTLMVANTDYRVRTTTMPGRISLPVTGTTWPVTSVADDAVRIAYTAGGSVPAMAKQAMLMLIGHWYENRESVVVGDGSSTAVHVASRALLESMRVRDINP